MREVEEVTMDGELMRSEFEQVRRVECYEIPVVKGCKLRMSDSIRLVLSHPSWELWL